MEGSTEGISSYAGCRGAAWIALLVTLGLITGAIIALEDAKSAARYAPSRHSVVHGAWNSSQNVGLVEMAPNVRKVGILIDNSESALQTSSTDGPWVVKEISVSVSEGSMSTVYVKGNGLKIVDRLVGLRGFRHALNGGEAFRI